MMTKQIFFMLMVGTVQAGSITWVKEVATGNATCGGGAVMLENYFPLNTCVPEYGVAQRKITCNSTHVTHSYYLKSVKPACTGTPAKVTVSPLCNPKTGKLTTCTTVNDAASSMSGETAKCLNPYAETYSPLDVCVKTGKVSTKASCNNGVLKVALYNASDCSGSIDLKSNAFYKLLGKGLNGTQCESVAYTGYSEYYTTQNASQRCPSAAAEKAAAEKAAAEKAAAEKAAAEKAAAEKAAAEKAKAEKAAAEKAAAEKAAANANTTKPAVAASATVVKGNLKFGVLMNATEAASFVKDAKVVKGVEAGIAKQLNLTNMSWVKATLSVATARRLGAAANATANINVDFVITVPATATSAPSASALEASLQKTDQASKGLWTATLTTEIKKASPAHANLKVTVSSIVHTPVNALASTTPKANAKGTSAAWPTRTSASAALILGLFICSP